MKTKILNALKTEYANLGLGDKAFDGVASFLEKTITDEAKIQDEIKTELVKNLLKSIQGESDSLRNRATKAEKDLEDYKKLHPETTPPTPPTPPTETENEKKLREQYEELKKRMDDAENARNNETTLASVRSRLETKEGCTNKGILNSVLKGFALNKDETEDAAIARLKEDYNRTYTETFGTSPVPPRGGGSGEGDAAAEAKAKNDWLRQQGLLPKEEKS